ncbi:TonB-dependent receptor [candidate division KSB1 bacterium]|nr:TonB-dependent receptor [candidate division KSB1 bacterium]
MKSFKGLLIVSFLLCIVDFSFAQESDEYNYEVLQEFGGQKVPVNLLNKISVDIEDEPLEYALATIADKSQLQFNYPTNDLPLRKRVSLKMTDTHVLEILLNILKHTGTSLKITNGGSLALVPQNDAPRSRPRAARGTLKGMVIDAGSGEPLPGANVLISGTNFGAATNIEGIFVIPNLPPGRYDAIATFIGYKSDTLNIQLNPKQTKTIEFKLSYKVVEGDEIVVTAQAEGQMEAINQQLTARQIVNVVSSDRIEEMPDANAAESVGRLPGVSINRSGGEASSVSIRGLSGGFNSVSIDGVKVPSTSDGRGVGLAFITPNMLDGIVLTKALTADMEGDATGGNVNFVLKDAPSGLRVQVDLKGGYSGLKEKIGMPKGELAVSNRFLDEKLGVMAQVSAYQDDRSTDYFNSTYAHASQYLLDQPGELTMDRFSLRAEDNIRNRFGASLVMDYRLPNGKIVFKNFFSQLNSSSTQRETRAKPQRGGGAVRLRHSYQEGVSGNYSNFLSGKHDLWIGTFDWMASHSYTSTETPKDWSVFFVSDYEAFTGTEAEKKLPPEELVKRFDWDMSKSEWSNHQVDYQTKTAREIGGKINYEIPFYLSRNLSGKIKFGGQYRQHDRDSDRERWILGTDLAGGYEEMGRMLRDSVFAGRDLELIRGIYPAFSSFVDNSVAVSDMLQDYGFLTYSNHDDMKVLADYFDVSVDSELPYFMREQLREENSDYENTHTYTAGYILSELNIGRRWTFLPGVRYEHVENEFHTFFVNSINRNQQTKEEQGYLDPIEASPSNTHWLPMVHLRYKMTNWADLRVAYTKTLRRPNFLDYSPIFYMDQESISRGNTDLKVETSQNWDAQVSVYSNALGLFTVGGFYKEIDNLIYKVTKRIRQGDSLQNLPDPLFLRYNPYTDLKGFELTEPVNNEPTAYVRGLELEWQTHFWYLPKPLDGLVLNANVAFIETETKYPQYVETKGSPPFYRDKKDSLIYREERLQNQPDLVGNVSLGYDKGGFSARLSYYYQGNTLNSISRMFPIEDKYKAELSRWDLKIRQNITRNLALFVDLNNFSNDKDELYYNIVDYLQYRQNYGWQSSLGIRYIFR